MDNRIDTAAMTIGAPASTVYQAFADPDAMLRWLPPSGMHGRMLEFDFREGGGYRVRLTYDDPSNAAGKSSADSDDVAVRFTELVPDRRIVQAVRFDSDDPRFAGEMRITWELEPRDTGTLVSVRCEDVPDGISPADHEAGLRSTLRNLAAWAEALKGGS